VQHRFIFTLYMLHRLSFITTYFHLCVLVLLFRLSYPLTETLWNAIHAGDVDRIAYILNNINVKGGVDSSTSYVFEINEYIDINQTTPALVLAANLNQSSIVQLLLDHGADPNKREQDFNETALFKASFKGYTSIVSILLQYNASSVLTIKNSETCLMWSSFKGHADISSMLIQAGADVNAKDDKYGFTPLMVASRNGHSDVVDVLLTSGRSLDIFALDKAGRSAIDLAVLYKHDKVVQRLHQEISNHGGLNHHRQELR
jgi:ankyrin repeat protein